MDSYDITGISIPTPRDQAISEIGGILRGEISATEAYRQVTEKLSGNPEIELLHKFLNDHQDAVEYWKGQLLVEGFEPENSSGFWGRAVEAFVATAKILGNTAAIAALREGEEHGLNQYKDMLESIHVSVAQKAHIRSVLLPAQQAHIDRLEGMHPTASH